MGTGEVSGANVKDAPGNRLTVICRHRTRNGTERFGRKAAVACSQHSRHDKVGGPVAVIEGLDVDQHLLTHFDPTLERGRPHMR